MSFRENRNITPPLKDETAVTVEDDENATENIQLENKGFEPDESVKEDVKEEDSADVAKEDTVKEVSDAPPEDSDVPPDEGSPKAAHKRKRKKSVEFKDDDSTDEEDVPAPGLSHHRQPVMPIMEEDEENEEKETEVGTTDEEDVRSSSPEMSKPRGRRRAGLASLGLDGAQAR